MPWNDRTGPVPRRTEQELLELVRAKAQVAGARRLGQLRTMSGVAALLLIVGLGTVVGRTGNDPTTELRTTSGAPTTSTTTIDEPSTTTSTLPSLVTSTLPVPPPPAVTTARRTSPSTTPTSAPPATTASTSTTLCRNSVNPACGPFRWDPPLPPNQPLTVQVTSTPTAPKAGETVTFRVVVDDPDGSQLLDRTGIANDYGDAPPEGGVNAHRDCTERWGPWTPGPTEPVRAELTFRHVYAGPGTYVASFPFRSLGDCPQGPRPSDGIGTVTVTVTP
ncbi:MAG: hypothetical protein ACR2KK_22105 [Acidimicrobiales bacterium]